MASETFKCRHGKTWTPSNKLLKMAATAITKSSCCQDSITCFKPAPCARHLSTFRSKKKSREWLINQAAGGYVDYDPATDRYSLAPEQSVALTDPNSPFYVGGGFYVIKAMTAAQPRILDSFKNGGGILWGDHDPDLFVGVEK